MPGRKQAKDFRHVQRSDYCQDLEEAKKIMKLIQSNVSAQISPEIIVTIKRGCFEYPLSFHEYSQIPNNTTPSMTYNREWQKHEDYADEHLAEQNYPQVLSSHSHSGFTLRDAIVMRNWHSYAREIGDASYHKLSNFPFGASE